MIALPMTDTLRAVLKRYVGRHVNLRPASAAQLGYSLSVLERHAGRAVTLRDCTTDFFCGWLRARLAGASKATTKVDRGNIVTLLRFAHREGLIDRVPEIPTIKQERKMPSAWTVEEVGQLLRAARSLTGYMRDLPITRSWWFTSFLLFLYDSGLRVNSALTLRAEDVWLDRKTARIRAATDKTWCDQVACLSDALTEMLADGMGGRQLVWPYPWHRRQLWRDLAAIRDDANLPSGRDHGFHRMRKTHATQCVISAGWEAARVSLGHSSETMTRAYVDLSQVQAVRRIELPRPKLTG